jgi:predicted aspartyl protease
MKAPTISRRAMLAGGAACLGGAAAPPGTAIPLQATGGIFLVPVLLNGHVARMVLDTGAERSIITRAAAARLGLPFDPWVETTMRGAGGQLERHPNADVHTASLGGTALSQRALQRGLSLAVTEFDMGGADGLLGADVLRHFTLELEFPGSRMALRPAGLQPAAGAVALTLLWPDRLLAPVTLNGQRLTALLDTGAAASLLNARGMHRLGLTPASVAADPPASIAAIGGQLPARLHSFTEFRLGGVVVHQPAILAAYVPEPAFDMTLGIDILGRQPLLLSWQPPCLGLING